MLAPPGAGPGPAGRERHGSGLELGHLTLAAAADTGAHAAGADATGAHAAGAQSTGRDGIARATGCAGGAGCAHSGVHGQVPAAGGAAGAACHGSGARHTEVSADHSAPGAADTCEPQSPSQNSDRELYRPLVMHLPKYL